jgi:uncharacterized membrane protein YhaH (DUF805 family)
MNQEVQDYIKKAHEAGMTDEQIKQELLKVGWRQNDIDQEFSDTIPPITPTPLSTSAPTQNIRQDNKSIFYYYLLTFKKYFVFKGRARRKEYWSFFLINFIISFLLAIIGIFIKDKSILSMTFGLIIMIPSIAVFIRRLHDIGKSGWWWLVGLIPVVGAIVSLVFAFKEGQADANKYGSNPKTNGEDTKSTNIFLIISAVILCIAIGILGYIYLIKPAQEPKATGNLLNESNSIKDWKTYTNEEYGFEIKYPLTDWWVDGDDHMYEIRNGGAFVLMGLADKNIHISIDEWLKKQYEYYLNYPGGNPIYAEPYDPAKITDYNFNGIPVKKTHPITFDYSGIKFYFKKGTNILYISYSQSDPNDVTFTEKVSTLNQILSTFKFIETEGVINNTNTNTNTNTDTNIDNSVEAFKPTLTSGSTIGSGDFSYSVKNVTMDTADVTIKNKKTESSQTVLLSVGKHAYVFGQKISIIKIEKNEKWAGGYGVTLSVEQTE